MPSIQPVHQMIWVEEVSGSVAIPSVNISTRRSKAVPSVLAITHASFHEERVGTNISSSHRYRGRRRVWLSGRRPSPSLGMQCNTRAFVARLMAPSSLPYSNQPRVCLSDGLDRLLDPNNHLGMVRPRPSMRWSTYLSSSECCCKSSLPQG